MSKIRTIENFIQAYSVKSNLEIHIKNCKEKLRKSKFSSKKSLAEPTQSSNRIFGTVMDLS